MPRRQKSEIKALLKQYGFDLKAMAEDFHEREVWNAFVFSNLERLCEETEVGESLANYNPTKWRSML
jgi:hypothetical protein